MAFDFGLSALKDKFSNTSNAGTSTSTSTTQKKHHEKQLFGANFYPR